MRRTIRWPPKVVQGRLAQTPDPNDPDLTLDDQSVALRQLIGLSLLDGNSGNPFNQALNLGVDDQTFKGVTTQSRAAIRALVRQKFRGLELARRARLASVDITREKGTKETGPILRISIEYENLETGRREELERTING